MTCYLCRIGKANKCSFGVLPCDSCTKKQKLRLSPHSQIEFTTDSIKNQRKAHRSDFMPMHNRGELDKAWLERYGAKKARQHGFTDSEIKNARYVWDGENEFYSGHNHN